MNKRDALKQYFGHSGFRQGQEEIIDALLGGRDALSIMPTGGGKSVCYQLPALMMAGITLVVSPLISLMQDQVAALIQAGVAAAYINSSLTAAQVRVALRRAAENRYKIIYIAPERLNTSAFLRFAMQADLSLVAVDEAHCVSQWGQDFRPEYLQIPAFVNRLPRRPVVAAFTATATSDVKSDIVSLLQLRRPLICTTGFDRPNLYFEVRKPKDREDELLRLVNARRGKSGIIYCATRKNVDKLCNLLRADGHAVVRYHAGLDEAERRIAQDDFQFDRAHVMVATNAFGMGIDKSNVSYVFHYNMPKNLESYYQEAGRAGRDGEKAECILLYARQDVMLGRWMIEHSDVNPKLTLAERSQLLEKQQDRLKAMTFYATGRSCLRRYILSYFGEAADKRCGNCSVCNGLSDAPARQRVAAQLAEAVPDQEADRMFAALRALRNYLAKQMRIPAYIVFTDATLRDMAAKQPDTEEQFLTVSGVGSTKNRHYGATFIYFIRKFKKTLADGQPYDQAMVNLLAKEAAEQGRPDNNR